MIYLCNEQLLTESGVRACGAPATKFDPRFGRRRLYCDWHGASDDTPIQLIDRVLPRQGTENTVEKA